MIQFLADNIDQLDLALDQLAIHDRNFDRFALMLVDNVTELTIHRFAQDRQGENKLWLALRKPKYDPKTIEQALGQYFDQKVKAAAKLGLLNDNLRDSILNLHQFRNTSYHMGYRHEGILHSITLFYFRCACDILCDYKPRGWSWSSRDRISHRARKYVGDLRPAGDQRKIFHQAFSRLIDVAQSMGDSLIGDLAASMLATVNRTDAELTFLANDGSEKISRDKVVIDCQAWPFAFTDKGKLFAQQNGCPEKFVGPFVQWIANNYKWNISKDPIKSWNARCKALATEKDCHLALKKYCDFLKQTEDIRSKIHNAAVQLDDHIQHLIDIARGK